MEAVGPYRAQRGCHREHEHWCYQTLPSYTVFLKKNLKRHQPRNFAGQDVYQRVTDPTWRKSVAKTKYTFPESCRFNDSMCIQGMGIWSWRDAGLNTFSRNHVLLVAMYHFLSMFSQREPGLFYRRRLSETSNEWPVDEYVRDYGRTVEELLSRW
jgi:hypothetical protein